MTDTSTITETDKLQCVERELGYRRRVYKRLLANGKITPNLARREIALMEAIVEDYRVRAESERLL